ncbi:MAG: nucleotidyltransferase [Candidatus Sulfotelmatobacter sp.]
MANEEVLLPISSSTPPEFLPDALECYRGVLESLQQAQIPHAVAGAFALHKHTGIWRVTKDLDIVLEAKSVPEALSRLQEMGFATRIEDPIWLAKAWRGEYFVDLITALGNAVLIVDRSWLDRAEPYDVFGVPCNVLAAEEVIASKVFISRRERFDGADIAHLIRACGSRLDWDRLQELLTGHGELLLWSLVFFAYVYPSRADIVPQRLWSKLMGQLQERVRHSNKDEPFRGTLIDPNMFAIDVTEWGERDLFLEYCARHPSLLQAIEAVDPKHRRQQ